MGALNAFVPGGATPERMSHAEAALFLGIS
jgi:hypothetical protein